MISAKIIEDSVAKNGKRLTTIEYTAPRFILAQFNTHRVFTRNAASSRAIPVPKQIEKVLQSPVLPVWNTNKPGMQGNFDVTPELASEFEEIWLEARDDAVKHARRMHEKGGHKQFVNRILEPYIYYKGVVSSTEWDNFFELRLEDAQPEIELVAKSFKNILNYSVPRLRDYQEWHLPYILPEESHLPLETKIKISVARCARVSYKTFDNDKTSTVDKDIELYHDLLRDKHLSCFEHQAYPTFDGETRSGNYQGWNQYRKLIELT